MSFRLIVFLATVAIAILANYIQVGSVPLGITTQQSTSTTSLNKTSIISISNNVIATSLWTNIINRDSS